MGTRHLTGVKKNGEWKIAQYGQWDGYPTGQGITVLDFLEHWDRAKFEAQLDKLYAITEEEVDKVNKDANWENDYPYLSRDMGAGILEYVQDNDLPSGVDLDPNFLNDSLFCEWAYVIDLDENVLRVYEDGNSVIATYALDNLPSVRKFAKLEFEDEEDWKEWCDKHLKAETEFHTLCAIAD